MLKYYLESRRKNVLRTVKRRKANWIGHMLRRNCLLKNFIKGKVEERITRRENEKEAISSYWRIVRKE
jgi:hypothetical protein